MPTFTGMKDMYGNDLFEKDAVFYTSANPPFFGVIVIEFNPKNGSYNVGENTPHLIRLGSTDAHPGLLSAKLTHEEWISKLIKQSGRIQ